MFYVFYIIYVNYVNYWCLLFCCILLYEN